MPLVRPTYMFRIQDPTLPDPVVESRVRRKKSRGGVGVFQYAQTVEDDDWDNAQRQKDIQVRHFTWCHRDLVMISEGLIGQNLALSS